MGFDTGDNGDMQAKIKKYILVWGLGLCALARGTCNLKLRNKFLDLGLGLCALAQETGNLETFRNKFRLGFGSRPTLVSDLVSLSLTVPIDSVKGAKAD